MRLRRQRLGLKLSELAVTSRVAYKTLANIETSGQVASIEVIYRLAQALDTEATDLLRNAGDAA